MKNLIEKIRVINNCDQPSFVPFYIEEFPIGKIHQSNIFLLDEELFVLGKDKVSLHPSLKSVEERTEKMNVFNLHLKEAGIIKRWRNEPYIVSNSYGDPIMMFIEREATEFYGTMKYGVHLNGYTIIDGEPKMWVSRRAMNKTVDPGKFDNLVSGGYNANQDAKEKMMEECYEEANIIADISKGIKPVSLISYGMQQGTFFRRTTSFLFDLELPSDFIPTSNDGEVDSFCLLSYKEILDMILNNSKFKDNCDLIIADFMIRHGILTPEMPGYVEVVKGLRM